MRAWSGCPCAYRLLPLSRSQPQRGTYSWWSRTRTRSGRVKPSWWGVLAFEDRIVALALKEGLVRVRQVLQDVPHSRETVLPQPGVLRVPPESRELLVQAEA